MLGPASCGGYNGNDHSARSASGGRLRAAPPILVSRAYLDEVALCPLTCSSFTTCCTLGTLEATRSARARFD